MTAITKTTAIWSLRPKGSGECREPVRRLRVDSAFRATRDSVPAIAGAYRDLPRSGDVVSEAERLAVGGDTASFVALAAHVRAPAQELLDLALIPVALLVA